MKKYFEARLHGGITILIPFERVIGSHIAPKEIEVIGANGDSMSVANKKEGHIEVLLSGGSNSKDKNVSIELDFNVGHEFLKEYSNYLKLKSIVHKLPRAKSPVAIRRERSKLSKVAKRHKEQGISR